MQCRFLVCIPVFNNPKTIVSVIEKCLVASPYPLLVVDDGSEKSVEDLCKEQNCDLSRITILRHSENHGKGVALQSAFKYALENNFTHLAALDGDGQHDPTDLKPLTGRAAQHPFSLIVGDREMRTENVPGSSTFGKAFSNFWVRYQTDVNVADSQSGYRV
ncbi:MAG: glycosyltransferase family 2 protein, partial [Pseudobdellovibrionaceae bacterium]